ncbi:MAG: arginine transporter [Pseudomonadota bacterium]
MTRVALLAFIALAACGGRGADVPRGMTLASGPIADACLSAGRENASQTLCRCVQGVADAELSRRDQSRAAAFFSDPQRAQDTRQSDNPALEAFWDRYRDFADEAERTCRPVA